MDKSIIAAIRNPNTECGERATHALMRGGSDDGSRILSGGSPQNYGDSPIMEALRCLTNCGSKTAIHFLSDKSEEFCAAMALLTYDKELAAKAAEACNNIALRYTLMIYAPSPEARRVVIRNTPERHLLITALEYETDEANIKLLEERL